MENKKNYYENDSRDMRNFNPRFNDLYQDYSDSQHDNHTFNLNGIIYVHNHNGGEPIPVGKVKSQAASRSTAKPNHSPSQRERNRMDLAGANRSAASTATAQRGNTARSVRPKAKPPVSGYTGTGRGQGVRNGWNQNKGKSSTRATRGFIVGFVVLFIFAMIVPMVVALTDFDKDNDFFEEDGDAYEDVYEDPEILERESQPLAEPITEEGVVYIMGEYIQIGATADTLWESYDTPRYEPQEPVQPGENYYVTLDLGEKYGVAAIILKNISGEATQDVNKFIITDVSANYYTEWGEDFDSTRTETDCEIIGGITIGMDYTEALWALSEVCDNPDMLNASEGNRGHLVGYSEKYYYSITIVDEEVSTISVTLKDTESEQ